MAHRYKALSNLKPVKLTSSLFLQLRHAEVVNTPATVFGGHKNNWDRIKRISIEANLVKVNYELKYAKKLEEAALKRGMTVKELQSKVSTKDQAKKLQPSVINTGHANTSKPIQGKKKMKQFESTSPTLDKIVKLDLLLKKDKESIAKIWTQYHADKDGISAVIPCVTYAKMNAMSKKYPLFILPMPRETGLEFFFLQFQSHQCNLTSLLEYKTKGEKARPFLTITHFPELMEEKDIVLMRGDINDNPKKMLSSSNAQFLAFAIQRFYSTDDPLKLRLIEQFNASPEDFNYQDLIEEMESVVPLG